MSFYKWCSWAEIYMQICVYPRLHRHMFSCNYQHVVGVRECMCVIFLLKIINTGVAPGRPAAYSVWLSTMPQKWSHSPIHPSLISSIHLLFRLKKLPFKQAMIWSDQTSPWTSPTPSKNIFFLCFNSSTCQFLWHYSCQHPFPFPALQIHSKTHTSRHVCKVQTHMFTYAHKHTPG